MQYQENVGCYDKNYWKKKSHQCLSSQLYQGEMFNKYETAGTFNNIFVNIGRNLAASIPELKTTFQNYIYYDGPCLSTINLRDLELENAFKSLKTN